jgi:transposase
VPESPDRTLQDKRDDGSWRERAERAERERDALRQEKEQLQRERARLQRRIDRLERELEAARRAGFRQAAPFAKPLKRNPRRPGRKAGRHYGPKARRRRPRHVDERHEALLPAQCPHCQGRVRETRVATQYQEEIPVSRPIVRQFTVHIGRCDDCRRRVQGRHPLQTSDALGAAAVQLGAQLVALVVVVNKQLGLSFGKIVVLLRQLYGVTVTRSGLVHAVHRAARQARPTYDALCAQVRGSPVVSPDETGWKVAGLLVWLWAFATDRTTVYRIQAGRGFAEAAAVLGRDFDGVLVRDGWAPYRRFRQAAHQTCLAHLLRRCRELRRDHPHSPVVREVDRILHAALTVRDRRSTGVVSAHGAAVARGRLITRLSDTLTRSTRVPAIGRFTRHLAREFEAIWSFLFVPGLDATNWRAEQALRPAVVTRKVCGGNRSWRGAESQQILASVIGTARQRGRHPHRVLTSIVRARRPRVATALH